MFSLPQSLRHAVLRCLREGAILVCLTAAMLVVFHVVNRIRTAEVADAATIQRATLEISDRPIVTAGKPLTISGIDLPQGTYTAGIITSPVCQFCVNSVPFHKRLVSAAKEAGVPLWVAMPSVRPKAAYRTSWFDDKLIVDWRDISRRFQGTPSVVLVGPNSVVRKVWVGQLDEDKEEEVIAAIRFPSRTTATPRVLPDGEAVLTRKDYRAAIERSGTCLINTAERIVFNQDHEPGEVNIPLQELWQRANRDLNKDSLNIVDCTTLDDVLCAAIVGRLRKMGFRAAAADLGAVEHENYVKENQ